ncbi:MAG: hypothetical protein Q7S55_02725 [Nanoarchaeota archaeon]|nr:hypothetical protein [Nanoarchaeota archaeon]
MEEYKLLSGEIIYVSRLPEEAQKHISRIESLVQESEDYFEVYRQAFVPLKERKHFTAARLRELHDSPYYKVILDLVQRHWQKTVGF